jgi:hypothetical protein
MDVPCENHTKFLNTFCGQNTEFLNLADGGTYHCHWTLADFIYLFFFCGGRGDLGDWCSIVSRNECSVFSYRPMSTSSRFSLQYQHHASYRGIRSSSLRRLSVRGELMQHANTILCHQSCHSRQTRSCNRR